MDSASNEKRLARQGEHHSAMQGRRQQHLRSKGSTLGSVRHAAPTMPPSLVRNQQNSDLFLNHYGYLRNGFSSGSARRQPSETSSNSAPTLKCTNSVYFLHPPAFNLCFFHPMAELTHAQRGFAGKA